MIDLHTHSLFSDGALIPSELVRRAEAKGLTAIGITDHGDASNIDFIIPRLITVSKQLNAVQDIKMIPGIELTHVPPSQIAGVAEHARALGAKIIIVHGETIVEPVAPGTNSEAVRANIDILAHPGMITLEDVQIAKERGVLLEITARGGHSLTNGYVAGLAKKVGAKMVINTDSHQPGDLIDKVFAKIVVKGAGLTAEDFYDMQNNALELI